MVALAVPRFGFEPNVNLARAFLKRAQLKQESGDLIAAGCLLRESMRRQFYAECAWKNCLPKGASDRTPPLTLLKALRSAGHAGGQSFGWLTEMIRLANAAAHCGRVDVKELRHSIGVMYCCIDADPCGEPVERLEHCQPADDCGGWDNDDLEDGDGWKVGAV